MIEITFEIGGKKVPPERVGKEMEKVLLNQLIENIKRKLSSLQCPEHGQYPKVTVKGKSMDKLSYHIDGCCQNLIDAAKKRLR